jgi:RHS repeat-associated protein
VYPPATLSTNAETAYLYTGQQYDAATAMYSLRARYYAPGAGRFVSRDVWPVDYGDPWELNRYGYTAGNPVRWTDSSGFAIDYKLLLSKVGAFVIARDAICISTVLCRNTVVGAATDGASYLLGLAIHNARTCQVDPKDGQGQSHQN